MNATNERLAVKGCGAPRGIHWCNVATLWRIGADTISALFRGRRLCFVPQWISGPKALTSQLVVLELSSELHKTYATQPNP